MTLGAIGFPALLVSSLLCNIHGSTLVLFFSDCARLELGQIRIGRDTGDGFIVGVRVQCRKAV